ncbi:hypothetical protein BDW75DRAFT_244525 [Aspergillus navahoensis]
MREREILPLMMVTAKKVTTPYAWNEDDAFRVRTINLSTGIAWYREHFKLPTTAKGDKASIEFEGIRHAGEFYLSDKLIDWSENGAMAFLFDITAFCIDIDDLEVVRIGPTKGDSHTLKSNETSIIHASANLEDLKFWGLLAGDSESDRDGMRCEIRVELMRDTIIYNRINPSVVLYEAENAAISEEHMEEMKERSRIPFWQVEYSRNKRMCKYWDDYCPTYHLDGVGPLYSGDDASSCNRNQDSNAVEDVERRFDYYEQRSGTGTKVHAGGVNIIFSDSNNIEFGSVQLPKDEWYAHRVVWDNFADIEKIDGHIIRHWNYKATTIRHHLPGLGEAEQSLPFHILQRHLGGGTLNAFKYSYGEKKSSGAPASNRLTSRAAPGGLVANGADIAFIDAEVVDEDGQRVPIALEKIDFTISGEATWRGYSVNRLLLRSTTQAGKMTLRAASEGLKSASITLATKSISVDSGLSTMPGKELQHNLSHVPTPAGRRAVEILNVAAGSAEDNAAAFIDDNEETMMK